MVATGGKNNEIHFEGYQVSNVAMALEAADILVPTFDAPELGYIRESTKDQFVPDVFYSVHYPPCLPFCPPQSNWRLEIRPHHFALQSLASSVIE